MQKKLAPFSRENIETIDFKTRSINDWLLRVIFIPLVMMIGFGILISRLFHITILKGAYYRDLANKNRTKEISLEAPRGKIFDRKGLLLASSQEIIKDDKLVGYKRIYPGGQATAHLVGFRQIASQSDIDHDACKSLLKTNDWVGKTGIEKLFDCKLRGNPGKKLVETNAHGSKQIVLASVPPRQGQNITLALDSELQQKAYEIVQNNAIKTNVEVDLTVHHIAIIATRPSTGEVILMFSYPTFNPLAFEEKNSKLIKEYLSDLDQPLFNRVTQGEYPPGSVFKPVVAIGALEDKKIDSTFTVEDTGTVKIGPQTFGNWFFLQYGRKDGIVDVVKAIQRSNDIFFYKTGELLGESGIKKWANKFGFGKMTGIGLPEAEGLIPTNFWKRETLKERWYLGDTYNLSIGQGYLLVTPLQMNQAIATIANNGSYCQPIIEKVIDKNKSQIVKCRPLNIAKNTLKLITSGMEKACQTGGTGWPFFNFGANSQSATKSAELLNKVTVACKTGTAQNYKESGLPHSWFTAYAPIKDPEIAITVLVDSAGEGSSVATPIAKEILEFYFSRTQ